MRFVVRKINEAYYQLVRKRADGTEEHWLDVKGERGKARKRTGVVVAGLEEYHEVEYEGCKERDFAVPYDDDDADQSS